MLFRFRRFQSRLLFFLILLLLSLQLAIYLSVRSANIENAKIEINNSLRVGAEVFDRIIYERTQNLFQYARLLSADYAFKPAFHSGDHLTILSAMENHLSRLDGAQIMILVDLDSKVIANTADTGQHGMKVSWPHLIRQAEQDEYAEATAIVMIDGYPFQIIVVPYFSPDISAWVMIGFAIDQTVASDLKSIIQSEISFASQTELGKGLEMGWRITASTFSEAMLSQPVDSETDDDLNSKLIEFIKLRAATNSKVSASLDVGDDQMISLVQPIDNDGRVYAVLQRSLNKALTPYLRLQSILQIIFWIALLGSAIIVVFIARKVTQPVKDLTSGAREIESGNYNARIEINLKDEVGELATSFNSMARGLEEKERVRNLLGKVVSTEIADELLSKEIELGGEEKQATILFSDIRSFTSICEGYSAKQILSMLNVYLTSMSDAIEINKGVIDKYIGDAIMALFGTPVSDKQDANHAVSAAMLMVEKLQQANKSLTLEQVPFQMGIGINTGQVVAGNMGSPSRLNYTVIGDAVNLASRLEGLTKFYGVEVIASESTKEQASDWLFQELDWVKVKGKAEPIKIYRPICRCDQLEQQSEQLIGDSSHVLSLYRERKWDRAIETLNRLEQLDHSNFRQIYLERIKQFKLTPPPQDWDHSFRFDSK